MRIHSFQIKNYKSYLDSGEVELGRGFNVVVGKNDAGKSALMEALGLNLTDIPHRSLVTSPHPRSVVNGVSSCEVVFELTTEELLDHLRYMEAFYIPRDSGPNDDLDRFDAVIRKGGLFRVVWRNGFLRGGWLERLGESIKNEYWSVKNNGFPGGYRPGVIGSHNGTINDYGYHIANRLRDSLYVFRAERIGLGECPAKGSTQLQPNAENLPDVLNQLSTTHTVRFRRLKEHLQTIFPHVTDVVAPINPGMVARVLIWTVPPETERSDLAVPLSESGTGIGQILAMLYVVVTSDSPRVICIDEPQSFLHPGALRKLIEILRSYTQHQYVITTHSPLSLSDSDTVYMVKKDGSESAIVRIDPSTQEDAQAFLAEVGSRVSDVFGADAVLWVEGKTEEHCFPILMRRVGGVHLRGVQVLGVVSTDELAARQAGRVYEIYTRLSRGTSLLPPALAFVFDREGRAQQERDDIQRTSQGLVRWLPRRMYENYLLEPERLAQVLNRDDDQRPAPVTPDEVRDWISTHGQEVKYLKGLKTIPEVWSLGWKEAVHGAHVLQDLFQELTQSRLSYDKVKHGIALTVALAEDPTPDISELARFLSGLVGEGVVPT